MARAIQLVVVGLGFGSLAFAAFVRKRSFTFL